MRYRIVHRLCKSDLLAVNQFVTLILMRGKTLRTFLIDFSCYIDVQTIASPLGALSLSRSGWLYPCPLSPTSGLPSLSEKVLIPHYLRNTTRAPLEVTDIFILLLICFIFQLNNTSLFLYLLTNRMKRGILYSMKKTDIKVLKDYAIAKGGKLLSDSYSDNKAKYKWQCEKGHTWNAFWLNVKYKNSWCPECAGQVLNFKTIKDFPIDNSKGVLLSKKSDYKNNKTKLLWKCNSGHEFLANWANVQSGKWCPECAGNYRLTLEKVKLEVKKKGGDVCSTEYFNAFELLDLKCSKGHTWKSRWNNVKSGKWCPTCASSGTSKKEIEILEFLVSDLNLGGHLFLKNQKILEGKEIDIYMPSKKFGIEYHGLYWHSEAILEIPKAKSLHRDKYLIAKKLDINLIQIFEDEWLDKSEIIKSMIKSKLGMSEKISARKCEVVEDPKLISEFFNKTHISGNTRSVKSFGLTLDGELVCAVSLRKPFTENKKGVIEIARFSSKLGTNIVGGFSKLLKRIEIWAKSQGFSKILTYADCRFGSGNVYLKSGFNHIGRTNPNYFYTNNHNRFGRFSKRKNSDPEFIKKYGNTEREQNNNQGLYAVYDAGSEIYEKIL